MRSRGWGFRIAGTTFPYLLFLVSYSLFPSVFAPLRALRETKNVQKVGHFGLPMLVLSPIMKLRPLPYTLFLIPCLLFANSNTSPPSSFLHHHHLSLPPNTILSEIHFQKKRFHWS